jgi:regulator of nucleoside diphosphate kinase
MNAALFGLLVVLGMGLVLWAVMALGTWLIRVDLRRRKPTASDDRSIQSRVVQHLQPIEGRTLELVSHSLNLRSVLAVLAASELPKSFAHIVHEVRIARVKPTDSGVAANFVAAALWILFLAGLVRSAGEGFVATGAGRVVLTRINDTHVNASADKLNEGKLAISDVAKDSLTTSAADGSQSFAMQTLDRNLSASLSVVPRVDDTFKHRNLRIPSVPLRPDDASYGDASDEEEMPVITTADHRELMEAIIAARKLGMDDGWTGLLQGKLVHATVVPRNDLPPDVITMHTRAELVDMETNERLELMLVYPVDANVAEGRISIFHPLAAAMLGRRVGEQVEWQVPYGARRFEVSAVQFQPEAALALAA